MTKQDGPTGRARLQTAAAWVGWHATELVALGLSVSLALTVSIWLWAVAALLGTAWIAREIGQYRRRAALRAQRRPRQLIAGAHIEPETAPQPQNTAHSESRHA